MIQNAFVAVFLLKIYVDNNYMPFNLKQECIKNYQIIIIKINNYFIRHLSDSTSLR